MSMMRKQRRSMLRKSLHSGVGILAAGALMIGGAQEVYALPQGGTVAAGAAEIAQTQAEMAIRQATESAVINWNSFNIAAGERVNIFQPSAQAALLNRVIGNNPSEIFGTLSANGRVFLVNPAGVLFAPGAQVDAGSIVASTMNITNADFMAGKYAFVGTPQDGKVINRASLIAQNEGTVALLGKDVMNEGVIVARKGAAVLAAGEAVSLDFNGDGKVTVVPTQAALEQAVTNKGLVEADGGLVFMSAATGDALTRSAVNQEGIVRAASLDGKAGAIRMTANDVRLAAGSVTDVSGTVGGTVEIGGGWQGTGDLAHAKNVTIERGAAVRADATEAGNAGGTVAVWSDGRTKFAGEITARGKGAGGAVETSGAQVQITGRVDASSEAGKAGEWLIDPGDIEVKTRAAGDPEAGSQADVQTVTNSLNGGTSVTIQTANLTGPNDNSITVSDAITKTAGGDATLSLKATGSVNINADITSTAGKLNVDITSDTNHRAGGSVSVATGKNIKTLGGNVKIGGGLVEDGVGFANSQSAGEAGITLNGVTIDTTDGATASGNVELAGSTTANAAGVSLTGATITAGAGKVTLVGKSTGGGKGIALGGNITTRSVELRTDSLDLSGTITGDGDPAGTAKVWTLSDGKTINFGTGTGGLDLAGDTFTSTGKIRNFKKNTVGDAAKKANIIANGVTADEDLEMYTGAGTLTVSGAVNIASTHALTLGSKNAITGVGVITTDTAVLEAADATVNLTGANAVKKLDGKAKGLTFKNSGNLTVGGETGVVTAAGGASLDVTGDLTVGAHGMTNAAGAMKLKASGTLKFDANAEVKSTDAAATSLEATTVNFDTASKVSTAGGTIDVKTDALTLPSGAQGTLSSANGKVTVETKTAGKTMAVGSSTPSDLVLPNLNFINSGTGEVHLGNASTGNVEIGTADVKAPLTVESGATLKFSGVMTNATGKDTTFKANIIDFASGANLASGAGTMTMTANSVTNWNDAAFADTNGAGTFVLKPKTAGNFTVGGTAGLVTDAGFGTLKAGNFKNVSIGAKDNAGTATIAGIASGNLPKYTSILTQGKINITGAINGAATDTLALHADAPGTTLGDGLSQSAPITVGNLLLLGKGSMDLSTQSNAISNIAADMADGDLKLKNNTPMKVAVVEDRTVNPAKNVDGLKTKSTDIKMDGGNKLTIEGKLTSTDDTKIEADDLDLGTNKVNVGKQLTLEKANKAQTINVGTGAGDWNIDNAAYGKIKIGGATQTGDVNLKGATFKKPSDIETTGKVTLTGTTKAGADGKSDMKIKAHTAELPTAADTLAVKNLDLDLSGGIDLGLGKINGQKDGKVTAKGASASQDIYISDNAADAPAADFRIAYRTINDTLNGFGGFDVAGEKHVYFYGGAVKKSINAAGKLGVEVRDNLSIEGKGTKLTIGADPTQAGHDPASVITGGFTVKQGKTVHVKGSGATKKGEGAEINIQTGSDIHLEQGATLKVEGNYAQATLNARNGDVVLNEDAKVQVAPGSTPVWVDVTGNKLQLDARAQLDSGTDTVGALRVHTDKIVTPAADDNTTNIVGKSGLVITRKTAGDLTLNNSSTGAGLHVTSDQLNGKLFGNQFSELVLGDNRSQTVTIDGLEANNRVVVKTAETGKVTVDAGGLKVGTDGSGKPYNVTLTTGAIENPSGGKMNIGAGSALNLYTNSIANLTPSSGSPSVTGTGTLGIGTYNGTKTIGLGDGATGDLQLTNNKFTQVFGPNFSHYAIGNSTQGTINVKNSSLGKDVTLQADNINFAGDMTLAAGKTLVVNAKTAANQTAGKITAAKLAAVGGNIALEEANEIGTLAADALSVKVKSDALNIGAITTPAGAPVASRTIKGVKAGESGGTAGDIELSADVMTFTEGVEGKGNLTIQQANAATNLNVGVTGTGLTLPENLFGGAKIKDGFKHVYLGREDATGATKVGGNLNFVDPTTIRSGKTAGSMTLDGSANIRTNGNDFALASKELTTAAGSSVDTGTGALTLKTDAIDLSGKMKGTKALNILPMSSNRDVKLGGSVNDPAKLSLLDKYFNGNNRQFWEYEIINIGDRGGTGRLYQSGVIDMPFRVNIQQAVSSGAGGVNLSGTINTHGRDYTVASREVNLDDAHINADGADRDHDGNVAIHTDVLNTANGSTIIGHGDVSFDTYSSNKTINFGTPGAGGSASDPTLPSDIFSGTGLLRKNPDGKGFRKIRIGGTNAENVKVGNVDLPEGLADAVAIKTRGAVTSTGVLKSVPTLEVEANSVNLTGPNEIKNLGDITSRAGVSVETKGGTNVTGVIKGNNAAINITNKDGGNVTIAPGGQIVGTGTSDVLIEAKGGAFKNKGGANAIQTAPGQRYVVHTEDSVENEIDGLVFEFRKYGVDYTNRGSFPVPAGKNAMFYKYQPELKLYSTRAYGDDNAAFFNSTAGFHIEDDGNVKRRALDKTEVDYIRDHVIDSGTHNFGTTKLTNVNADVNTADGTVTNALTDVNMRSGAHTYGSDSTIANEKITYIGHNDLNYKITVDYRIVPRVVTVTGKTETVNYDGTAHSYTGNAGVTFSNFANSQTAATPGLLSGSVSYTPIADAAKTTGYAQGAVHAGEYSVDLKNSTLTANNYKFKYVPGKLTIKPIDIHFTAPSGERIYGTANDSVTIPAPSYTGSLATGDSFAKYTVTAVDGGGNAVTERTGIGTYAMTLDGVALASGSRGISTDYNITSTVGTLTIKKRPLTITAGDKSRFYGDANTTAGYVNNTAKVNVAVATATTGLVNGDTIDDVTETIDPAATVTTNAGTAGLWTKASAAHFSSGTAANYDINYVDGHFNITKRALALVAGDKSRIYGTANSTASYVNGTNLFRVKAGTNLVNGDTISSVTETIDSRATVTTDAGTAGLKTTIAGAVFGTGNANNYDISYEDGSFAITPRDLTLRAGDKTRIYGTENTTAVYTGGTSKFRADAATATTGLVNGDAVADVTESTNATRTTNVGATGLKTQIANATFGTGKASNYNISYVDGGFDITKRDLYITAGDKSRTYGDDNETAQYVNGTSRLNVRAADATTGLVNGDTISSITETIDPTATVTTDAGTGGLWTRASAAQFAHGTDANYNIHYADGAFNITKRALTLVAGDKSRIYGTANSTASYVNGTNLFRVKAGTNLVNGDTISSVTETIDPRATVTTDAGTAGLKTMIGSAVFGTGNANNYDVSYEDGSFAITPRDLTLRAGDKTCIYGTENSTAIYTGGTTKFRADAATATTGLVNGDAVADVTESTNATRTTNVGATGLKTQIANATFGTGKASNYNISYVDGGFDITKRDLYITAGDKERAFGAENATARYVNGTQRINVRPSDDTTGLANGDAISSIMETIDPTATVTTDAGTGGLWTRASAAQFSQGTDANYNILYVDGRFAIVPREVLVTAGDVTRDYGAPNPVVTEYVVERGDRTSWRGLLAGDEVSGIRSYYDAAITPTTQGGSYPGVIHVDPASVTAGYTGASAISNYRFRYAPGRLKIQMRGFDMSTPEGRAVITSTGSVTQVTAGLTGVAANRVPGSLYGGTGAGSTGIGTGGASGAGGRTGTAGGRNVGGIDGNSGTSNGAAGMSGGSAGSTGNAGGTGSAGDTNAAASTGNGSGAAAQTVVSAAAKQDRSFADGVTIQMPQEQASAHWTNRVVVSNGKASEAHSFITESDGTFGFDLGRTRGIYGHRPDDVPGNTSEAIPVLFTDGGTRDLDGIYSVNYSPEKLAIKPSSKKVDIPDPKEIRNTSEQALSFLYQTQNGAYEVTFGNGIVTLYPQDDAALNIITNKDRKAARAVLSSGILTAIEDLGVTPVEIRAVYIFNVLDGQSEE
ncbi:filamentous hemagglutinin outer membrane protein [Centipeda periodontii DSM 2778]|uniref:Filamentous hemagglutinin outer membrane protein n=1 Tax=Centipeda periodontii DSM 2778 TaxID=888060 RepID=F5RP35_9FIRM|nr:MBG domain-containing protein [Centipeda periodontii]EGK58425.1 filamentous hemagglutinin outer membrane protein [Centipeda periodontii DSM 2778]